MTIYSRTFVLLLGFLLLKACGQTQDLQSQNPASLPVHDTPIGQDVPEVYPDPDFFDPSLGGFERTLPAVWNGDSSESAQKLLSIFDSLKDLKTPRNQDPFMDLVDSAERVYVEVFKNPASIGINKQFVLVSVNGQPEYTFLTSTAGSGWSTPNGSFKVRRLHTIYESQKYGGIMDYAMFFNGGIALHTTDTRNISKLGRGASHGCVRLTRGNAKKLFRLALAVGPSKVTVRVRNHRELDSYERQLVPTLLEAEQNYVDWLLSDDRAMSHETRRADIHYNGLSRFDLW